MVAINLGFELAVEVHKVPIKADLVGASMSFMAGGRKVRIELPTDMTVKSYYSPFLRGEDKPSAYDLHRLYVRMRLDETRELPKEILTLPMGQFEIVPKEDQLWLTRKAEDLNEVARSLYQRWLNALRWKLIDGAFGRLPWYPQIGSASITNSDSGNRIWGKGSSSDILDLRTLRFDLAVWREIEAALQNDGRFPVSFDLLFDAEENFELGNLDAAVIQLAVACEVFMKARLHSKLPPGASKSARERIDRSRVRKDNYKIFKGALTPTELGRFNKIEADLDKLFEARNTAAHEGSDTSLTDDDCFTYVNTARDLLLIDQPGPHTFMARSHRFHRYQPFMEPPPPP